MKKARLWLLLTLLCLVLTVVLACTPATTPTAAPTAKPKPSPTAGPTTSLASPGPAGKPASSAAAVSLAGKTVTIVVTTAPGGGTDIVARIVARHLPRFLPGNPSVVVRNIPGAASTLGANFAYSSKPDGLTALATAGGVLLGQLFGSSAAQYDLRKMTGFMSFATGAMYFIRSGIVTRPEDLLKAKGVIFGHSTGGNGYGFVFSAELLAIPVDKVILAYAGGGDARRAFLAGELNASSETGSGWNEVMKPYADRGEIISLFQSGILDKTGDLIRDPSLPVELMTTKELYQKLHGKDPSGIGWDSYKVFVGAMFNYLKTYFVPPNTPDNILRAYWSAGENLLKDPTFHKEADPVIGQGVVSVAGEAADKEFKLNFRVDPKAVEWLTNALAKYKITIE